jgi:hypothetical protein
MQNRKITWRTIFTFSDYPEAWEDDEDIDERILIESESDLVLLKAMVSSKFVKTLNGLYPDYILAFIAMFFNYLIIYWKSVQEEHMFRASTWAAIIYIIAALAIIEYNSNHLLLFKFRCILWHLCRNEN